MKRIKEMITLYQFLSSPLCEKARRILAYKGLDYQIHEVDRTKTEELKHVSPFGKFPAMEHDGEAVCDSTDIAHYLEEKYPANPLIPADPVMAAQAHIIEDWADESLYFYEITMRVSWEHNAKNNLQKLMETMPEGVTEEQGLELALGFAQNLSTTQGIGRKTREQVCADVERHLKALSALLSETEWLVGDSMTLADIAVISQLNCLIPTVEVAESIKAYPNITEWMARVDAVAPA
jgi:glutathione S-transferase